MPREIEPTDRRSDIPQILPPLLHLLLCRPLVVVLFDHVRTDVRALTDGRLRDVVREVVRDPTTTEGMWAHARGTL